MPRRAVWLAGALSLICLSGCGTVYNLSSEKAVYGGVGLSLDFGRYVTKGMTDLDHLDMLPSCAVIGAYCFAVDLPLSALADTLTLPVTLPLAMDHWKSGRSWRSMPASEPADPAPDSWLSATVPSTTPSRHSQ
jgi:uncharacterized protein YceK